MIEWEAGLDDREPRIVTGLHGPEGKPFAKLFRNNAAMLRWARSPDAQDHDIYEVKRTARPPER